MTPCLLMTDKRFEAVGFFFFVLGKLVEKGMCIFKGKIEQKYIGYESNSKLCIVQSTLKWFMFMVVQN